MAAVLPSVTICKYSDKAGVVFGEGTRALKDKLKAAKCRFNPKLTINGVRMAGWIFPLANRAIVAAAAGLDVKTGEPPEEGGDSAASASAADTMETFAVKHESGGGGPVAAAVEEAAVGPSAVAAAMKVFSAPDSSFLVVGPTFFHKAALKAAGGEWVSGWQFPAAAREAVDAVLAGPADAVEPRSKGDLDAPKAAGHKRARSAKRGRARARDADE